jgi:hypothetical protein
VLPLQAQRGRSWKGPCCGACLNRCPRRGGRYQNILTRAVEHGTAPCQHRRRKEERDELVRFHVPQRMGWGFRHATQSVLLCYGGLLRSRTGTACAAITRWCGVNRWTYGDRGRNGCASELSRRCPVLCCRCPWCNAAVRGCRELQPSACRCRPRPEASRMRSQRQPAGCTYTQTCVARRPAGCPTKHSGEHGSPRCADLSR